jgi:hypothetical protein
MSELTADAGEWDPDEDEPTAQELATPDCPGCHGEGGWYDPRGYDVECSCVSRRRGLGSAPRILLADYETD